MAEISNEHGSESDICCQSEPGSSDVCAASSSVDESNSDSDILGSDGGASIKSSDGVCSLIEQEPFDCNSGDDWRPGHNCGTWINRRSPLLEQGQVLVVNAVAGASQIPIKLARQVLKLVAPMYAKRIHKENIAHVLVAGLCCISVRTVDNIYKSVTMHANAWRPCKRRSSNQATRLTPALVPHEDDIALRNLVRLALATPVEGRSAVSFERDVLRCRLSGACMGERYASRKFVFEVAALGAMVVQQLDALDFNQELPGLGIPSDFALLADPVSMGSSVFSKHDILLITCLALVSAHLGNIYNPMHSGHAIPLGKHKGHAMADFMIAALLNHPARWGLHVLRARLASFGADGGLCLGGKDHRHKSASTAERVWRLVHPDPTSPMCTTWDPFHRIDIAVWRAIRGHGIVLSIFDTAKEVDWLFGTSEGLVIFRSVARHLGTDPHPIRAPGGTRKVVYLTGVPGSLVGNYKLVQECLWARVAWKQAGYSSQSIAHLLDVGRRLREVKFVTVMLIMQDVLCNVVRRFALHVEKHLEPAAFHKTQQDVLEQIAHVRVTAHRCRSLVRVAFLVRTYVTVGELSNFWDAFAHGSAVRQFPTFFRHCKDILISHHFQGCKLEVPHTTDPSSHMLLAAHCQCAAIEKCRSRGLIRGKTSRSVEVPLRPRAVQRINVPCWVVAGAPIPRDGRCAELVDAVPRCTKRTVGLQSALGHTTAGMFSKRGCQVSHQAFLIHEECNAGLVEAEEFLKSLYDEISLILGAVGTNDSMGALLRGSGQCWDWSRLLFERPGVDDIRAFQTVCSSLSPLLAHTMFPEDPSFGTVEHRWPHGDVLAAQYMKLCERVRRAAASRHRVVQGVPEDVRRHVAKWARLVKVEVRFLIVCPVISATLLHMWQKNKLWKPVWCWKAACRISQCLGTYALLPSINSRPDVLCMSPACLKLTRSRRRLSKQAPTLAVGDVVMVQSNHVLARKFRKAHVEVLRLIHRVEVSAVSKSLDINPWFAIGAGMQRFCAWAAVRVHHR